MEIPTGLDAVGMLTIDCRWVWRTRPGRLQASALSSRKAALRSVGARNRICLKKLTHPWQHELTKEGLHTLRGPSHFGFEPPLQQRDEGSHDIRGGGIEQVIVLVLLPCCLQLCFHTHTELLLKRLRHQGHHASSQQSLVEGIVIIDMLE